MLEYKTRALPNIPFKGIKKKEFYGDLSLETVNRAVAPIGQIIESEAQDGWVLHSIKMLPQTLIRKKTIWELLFGWIPILGRWLFPLLDDTRNGRELPIYVMTFVKES